MNLPVKLEHKHPGEPPGGGMRERGTAAACLTMRSLDAVIGAFEQRQRR